MTALAEAAAKAQWWRREIAAGRVSLSSDVECLLRDLETAGGRREGPRSVRGTTTPDSQAMARNL